MGLTIIIEADEMNPGYSTVVSDVVITHNKALSKRQLTS